MIIDCHIDHIGHLQIIYITKYIDYDSLSIDKHDKHSQHETFQVTGRSHASGFESLVVLLPANCVVNMAMEQCIAMDGTWKFWFGPGPVWKVFGKWSSTLWKSGKQDSTLAIKRGASSLHNMHTSAESSLNSVGILAAGYFSLASALRCTKDGHFQDRAMHNLYVHSASPKNHFFCPKALSNLKQSTVLNRAALLS